MLSFAGRLTLTKSVLQSLATYAMQSAYVPHSICEEIHKRCQNFVWGDSVEEKKIHLVSWKKFCTPKKWAILLMALLESFS